MLSPKSPEQLVSAVYHSLQTKSILDTTLITHLRHALPTMDGTALFGLAAAFSRSNQIVPSSLTRDLLSKAEDETPDLPPSQLSRLPGILKSIGLPFHTLPIYKNLEICNMSAWEVSHLAGTVGPLPCLKPTAWKFPGNLSACQFGEKSWFDENEAITPEAASVALAAAATWKFKLSDSWLDGLKRKELTARQAQEISWGLCCLNLPFDFLWENAESVDWASDRKRMQCIIERGEIPRSMRYAALLSLRETDKVEVAFSGFKKLQVFENGYVCDYYNDECSVDIAPSLSMEMIAYFKTKRRHLLGMADFRVWNVCTGTFYDFSET